MSWIRTVGPTREPRWTTKGSGSTPSITWSGTAPPSRHGIELVTDKSSKTPADPLGRAVTTACLERGLHVNIVQFPGMGGIFRIAPPLTIEATDLHADVDTLEAALLEVLLSTP